MLIEYRVDIPLILYAYLQGLSHRKTSATCVNAESSRSHSVFTCVVESRGKVVDSLNSNSIPLAILKVVYLEFLRVEQRLKFLLVKICIFRFLIAFDVYLFSMIFHLNLLNIYYRVQLMV